MSLRSSDLYLHALCLAAYAPSQPTTKIAKVVVDMFDEFSKDERSIMSPINLLYIKLLRQIAEGTLDLSNRSEVSTILLQYQDDPAFKSNKFSFNELSNLLMPEQLPSPSKIKMLFNKIKGNIAFYKGTRRIRKMMLTAQKAGSEDDVEKQQALFKDILAAAESLRADIEEDPSGQEDEIAQVDEIDFTDKISMKKALAAQHKKRNGAVVKFGLQGLNRMLGPSKSVSYGESLVFAASSHNYKSGMLLDCARWIATYNKPPDCGGRTPVILFISLENEIAENFSAVYTRLFENMYHKSPSNLSDEEIIEYVSRQFGVNGFKFKMYRKMGEAFGYREFVELVEKIEKCNCKVVVSIIDYVSLSRRCPEDKHLNDPKQLQLMFSRYKDFCAHRDMLFITGLQLDTEASRLASSGMTCIAKRLTEFHLSDAKSLKKEIDILIFMYIEPDAKGRPWLTLCLNKRRYAVVDPEDKYCGYLFTPLGIMDDINGKDESTKDIYSATTDDSDSGTGMSSVSVF